MALIFEDSQEVRQKSIKIPKNTTQIFKALAQAFEPYLDTVEGGKVLKSYASDKKYNQKKPGSDDINGEKDSTNTVPVDVAKMRLSRQNKFSPDSIQYQMYGGQVAHNLLKKGIESARAQEKVPTVKPPKPTVVDTKPDKPEVKPIDTPKGQITIKESEEDNPYYDYLSEYNEQAVISEFFSNLSSGIKRQNWSPLIPLDAYAKALREFTQYGQFMKFPGDMVYKWMGIIMRNTAKLRSNNVLCGHESYRPDIEIMDYVNDYLGYDKVISEDYETLKFNLSYQDLVGISDDILYNPFSNDGNSDIDDINNAGNPIDAYNEYYDDIKKWCNKNESVITVNKDNGQVLSTTKKYDIIGWCGYFDWCEAPDGSCGSSDYGLEPLEKIISEYDSNMPPEDVLVLINRILDVYHCNGDLASLFIEGGSRALSAISEEIDRKTIIISEEQAKLIKEYYDQQRFNFDDEGEAYYEKDTYQLYIDFLENIGQYGQLPQSKRNKEEWTSFIKEEINKTVPNYLQEGDEDNETDIKIQFIIDEILSDTVESSIRQPIASEIKALAEQHPDYDENDWKSSTELFNIVNEYGFSEGHVTPEGMEYYNSAFREWNMAKLGWYGFPYSLNFDERDLIYIERQITIPQLDYHGKVKKTYHDLYKYLTKHYDGVGNCWSWKFGGGEAYCGDREYSEGKESRILLRGYVDPSTVDWRETILRNLDSPNEMELYIREGNVEIDYVDVTGIMHGQPVNEKTIFNKPIIVKI